MTYRSPTVVLAPDSFKGSLDAPGVSAAMAEGFRRGWPAARILQRPMADGGEGTLEAVLAAVGDDGSRRTQRVTGASGAPRDAAWGLLDRDGERTAVIEVAQVVGITDAQGMAVSVRQRSTSGVGELLRTLMDAGITSFMIGLGGSSTNDGGAGCLAALGLQLTDAQGHAVMPTPDGLAKLAHVEASSLDARLREARIVIMSDVSNPLNGELGATAIFGPQKGVVADEIAAIDDVLGRFAALAERACAAKAADRPGAGAAGGLGFALQLLGAQFASGAEVVADLVGLDAALEGAHWAITGEGRSDAQTLLGKAPAIVANRAKRAGVPASLLSGAVDERALAALNALFTGCFALPARPLTLDQCVADAASLLADRAEALGRVLSQCHADRIER